MGLTVSVVERSIFGNKRFVTADVTYDSSYPTGGESLLPSDLGLAKIDQVLPAIGGSLLHEYVYNTQKLKALTPMPAHAHDLKVIGGASAAGTGTVQVAAGALKKEAATDATLAGGTDNIQNATAAAASEVANTTNLSAITVRLAVIGY